ncbi:MAG TPA: hypothetical protein VNZ85_14630 [Caulobacter sp.]|nr:hypothetical protein [Caulobacter sp.]
MASLIVSTVVGLVALWASIDARKGQAADQASQQHALDVVRHQELRSRDDLTQALNRHAALEQQNHRLAQARRKAGQR